MRWFLFVLFLSIPSFARAQVTFTGSGFSIPDVSQAASTISISGYQGTVSRVTVTLTGLTHTFTSDLAAIITGPTPATKNTLLFDGPGVLQNPGTNIANVNLTFDDLASVTLPSGNNFGSGTYRPGLNVFGSSFDLPAPEAPYNTDFSSFNGTFTNGNYTLFAGDFSAGSTGTLTSWSLTVYGISPVPEPSTFLLGGLAIWGLKRLRHFRHFRHYQRRMYVTPKAGEGGAI